MLRFIVFVLLAAVALLLQTTWLSPWPSQTLRFEFVWIIVLYLGFATNLTESGLTVITLGFMEDLTGTPFIGFFASIYFLFFILLRSFITHMFVETLWARLLWVGILSLLATVAEWGLMAAVGQGGGIRPFLLTYGLLQSLVNMVVAAILFPLFDRLDGMLYNRVHGT